MRYVIIKENFKDLKFESTILRSIYKDKKYAMIEKVCLTDDTEKICRIVYSDDLTALQSKAEDYISWYNYPLGFYKQMNGTIKKTII